MKQRQIEYTVAREMGLVDAAFSAAIGQPDRHQPSVSDDTSMEEQRTGHDEYDYVVAGLSDALANGEISSDEAQAYGTISAQIAMSGLTIADAEMAVVAGIENLDDTQLDGDTKSMLGNVQAQIEAKSTAAALGEIGQEGFDELQQMAEFSTEVAEAVRGYAVRRATGDAEGLTWTSLLQHAREHLAEH